MRKKLPCLAVMVALCALAGCGKPAQRVVIDRTGEKFTVPGAIQRIVSTAPSNTEIIVDLGLADKLVAVDRHSAASIYGLSDSITAIDFFYPDAEALINLAPDIIIASGHNTTGSGDDPFRLLREAGIPVTYISMSKNISAIYDDIMFIAELLQVSAKGQELVRATQTRIERITAKTARIEPRKSVYFEIAAAPEMYTFGKDTFLDDMITAVGARNIFGNDNWLVTPSVEAIIDRNPDVILTNVDYIADPIGELCSRTGFNHLDAVINKRVYQIDTNSSVRPSARITLALEQMAQAVYPELYEE